MTLIGNRPQLEAPQATEPWRLLVHTDMPGDFHMALDEVLLESVIAGGAPVVRLYTWQPATLSIGVNQAVGEIDREEIERRGFGLVRRLTGGRAVLHQHELTYSVIARENDPRVSGGVIESYRKISAALVEGLRLLGLDVGLAEPNKALYRAMAASRRQTEADDSLESSNGAVCFDVASAYEITAGGKKLVGSAQARRGGVILQHGSILLDIDWDAWVSVFAYASDAGKERAYTKLPTRMTSLRHELRRVVYFEEVMAALARSFPEALGIGLTTAQLSVEEDAATHRLIREKYGADAWTLKS